MAEIHGAAGEWARVKGTVVGLWPAFLAVFAAGASCAAVVLAPVPQWGALFLALSLAGLGFALMRGMRRVESFFKGARGEERVAWMLRSLPDRYHVFNDFVAGRAHVDHVVVGPAGVFAVETKNWRGLVTVEDDHVLVDGRLPSRSPVSQVLREAALVKAKLASAGWSGRVIPVLAFASDTFRAHIAEVRGAVIMNSSELARSFSTETVAIPPTELERLVALMENL